MFRDREDLELLECAAPTHNLINIYVYTLARFVHMPSCASYTYTHTYTYLHIYARENVSNLFDVERGRGMHSRTTISNLGDSELALRIARAARLIRGVCVRSSDSRAKENITATNGGAVLCKERKRVCV